MKLGYPPGNELMAPCWRLRKIINSTVPETVGNMLGLLGGFLFNPGYQKTDDTGVILFVRHFAAWL